MVRNQNDKFDSKVVCALKGIAIILMVCNHLYPIPEWIFPIAILKNPVNNHQQ